jgi:single-strand selective monofunctional uracil DNA glycosylase
MLGAAADLRDSVKRRRFAPPVSCVYHPLDYAWAAHEAYLTRYATNRKRTVFLGMNPGPFGMVQTGIPFGEVSAVRDWLGIKVAIEPPLRQHPKRMIRGFDCPRTEISGQRLWRLFAQQFGTAEKFFSEHFVVNYCPLAFLEESGCNRTPDKLPIREREPLFRACDQHLREVIDALQPEWLIGIGDVAAKRAQQVFSSGKPKLARILHPSPASPAANRDWAARVTRELQQLGVWQTQRETKQKSKRKRSAGAALTRQPSGRNRSA